MFLDKSSPYDIHRAAALQSMLHLRLRKRLQTLMYKASSAIMVNIILRLIMAIQSS